MLRLRSNCNVMFVEPSELVDDMLLMPAIVENSFSSGVATEEAMVSGFAPGKRRLDLDGRVLHRRQIAYRQKSSTVIRTPESPP